MNVALWQTIIILNNFYHNVQRSCTFHKHNVFISRTKCISRRATLCISLIVLLSHYRIQIVEHLLLVRGGALEVEHLSRLQLCAARGNY